MRRATDVVAELDEYAKISIHALLAESDRHLQKVNKDYTNFYPRSPCGERHARYTNKLVANHFYPRSPCGERPVSGSSKHNSRYFYPRSPCGERRQWRRSVKLFRQFLSTLSLRRATRHKTAELIINVYFYPRSPCGERLTSEVSDRVPLAISIHALLAESDERANRLAHAPPQISIHALLAESDNRRPIFLGQAEEFLSTLSLRRATETLVILPKELDDFYPRSPCGERRKHS